jgi:hypothetical protein
MAVFTWHNHRVETRNPESGFRIQFGNSWSAAIAPTAPDQRVFVLHFEGFKYYVYYDGPSAYVDDGSVIEGQSNTRDARKYQYVNNFQALRNFYADHKLHKQFDYIHPIYGNLVCRFNKPLIEPKGLPDGLGVVEPFQIELIEVPL